MLKHVFLRRAQWQEHREHRPLARLGCHGHVAAHHACELTGGQPAGLGPSVTLKNRQGGGKDLSGTIAQRLNFEHQIHHTVSKLCILAFEPLK